MKEYDSGSLRNIAFIGHGGSGKTSLSEIILYTAGETTRIGSISEGNTVSDYTPNEKEKQISISTTLMHVEWNNSKLNIIDTPGYSDFVGEVFGALKVCDTAVMVLKSAEGVEVGTESASKITKTYNNASAVIINKVDNEHSKFFETFEQVKDKLSHDAVVISFPYKEGPAVDTIIDVVRMKAFTYGPAGSKKVSEINIPDDVLTEAETIRLELMEKVAETSEDLMNKYFEEGTLTNEELELGIKTAIIKKTLTPVFGLSSTKAVGINNFLDFATKYFPTPLDMDGVEGELKDSKQKVMIQPNDSGEPVMFIFKTIAEQHVGELSLFKVYSGTIAPGMDLVNQSNSKPERVSQISILNGHNRKDITRLHAGDLGAVVKLKDSHTNNTLSSKNFGAVIPKIPFPAPVISEAIIPKAKGDEDKIASGLHNIHQEDPTFSVKFEPELAQTIVSGQGELQLALAVKRLKERYNVDVDLAEPRIPYRETIKGVQDSIEFKHKKQSGGRGQYGHVVFKMEPLPRGKGFEFVDAIVGGVVPRNFIPAVEKGVQETLVKGVISGNKVVDVKVTLHFGSYHDVDSDEMSFKIAAAQCFRKGFLECKPILLEPIYEVEIKVPEEYMGDVMGDVSSRRGKILGMDSDDHVQIIKAYVPLSELHKYSSTLRSLTQGRGQHQIKFAYYEEVPKEVENKIIDEYKKSREEA